MKPDGLRSHVLAVMILSLFCLSIGCRAAYIYTAQTDLVVSSEDAFVGAAQEAGEEHGWDVRVVQPGRLYAIKQRGRHIARTLIEHDARGFEIHHLGSVALQATELAIHETYNVWVQELETAIATRVGGARRAR